MPSRDFLELVRHATPSDRCVPLVRDDALRCEWGPAQPFNERTVARHLMSEARRKAAIHFDSLGRVISGPNRL
jgi:hypothetical protein